MIRATDHALRLDVNAHLERPVDDREWDHLDREKLVHQYRIGEVTPAGLAVTIQQRRVNFGQRPTHIPPVSQRFTTQRGGEITVARVSAISELVAQDAETEPSVVEFRRQVLGGKLLKWEPDSVQSWIDAQDNKDPSNFLLTVVLPSNVEWADTREGLIPKKPLAISAKYPGIKISHESLDYAGPDSHITMKRTVSYGGVLDRLRIVSERLANKYGWQKMQGTVFTLTGIVPIVEPHAVAYSTKEFPVLARITLTLDPALSPREVARLYRTARERLVGKRHRSLSEKHSTLVLFIASRPARETYARSMDAWNKKYRKWKYRQVTNFGRDVLVARRRLLESGPNQLRPLEMLAEKGKRK